LLIRKLEPEILTFESWICLTKLGACVLEFDPTTGNHVRICVPYDVSGIFETREHHSQVNIIKGYKVLAGAMAVIMVWVWYWEAPWKLSIIFDEDTIGHLGRRLNCAKISPDHQRCGVLLSYVTCC
jgi:hypothetical protein